MIGRSIEYILDRPTSHELTYDVKGSRFFEDIMDRDDVGMIAQPSHRLSLSSYSSAPGLIETRALYLSNGYAAFQQRVLGQIHELASTLAKQTLDQIAASTDRSRQGLAIPRRLAGGRG